MYFTTDNTDHGFTRAWQGGIEQYNFEWATDSGHEQIIYVDGDFIRQASFFADGFDDGAEYDLAGNPTGTLYHFDNNGQMVFDAGFDGTNVYTVDFATQGEVWVWDKDYTNGRFLFRADHENHPVYGITWDGNNQTLWTCGWGDGRVRQWDMSGELVSEFSVGFDSALAALAWDPAGDTLWLNNTSINENQQYDKAGNLLMTYQCGAYSGGEISLPSPDFDLAVGTLIGGQKGQFDVTGAEPSQRTVLAYSLTGFGEFYVPPLNITLDIDSPIQAGNPKNTDEKGSVSWTLPIPKNARGKDVWLQAAQFDLKSNVVATWVN
ncbi:MAG: hypothetical protein D8M59_07585 [Planctomycetes bacterium]|nr:hypothetical protein [Planctomycetota bacterium]